MSLAAVESGWGQQEQIPPSSEGLLQNSGGQLDGGCVGGKGSHHLADSHTQKPCF